MSTNWTRIARLFTCLLFAIAVSAEGQASRTWVSGVGDDANPCSRTAPCKTFAGAISKTAAAGEISVLDPGGFGAVTITKAITINGEGTLAGILAAGTNGIIINAAAGDEIIIKNISIHGFETGIDGIRYLAGGQVTVENVTISGFQTAGSSNAIEAALTADGGRLIVRNVSITNCESGIKANTTTGSLKLELDNVRIENTDGHGLEAISNVQGVVSQSMFVGNAFSGLRSSGGTTVLNVDKSVFMANNVGISTGIANARVRISDSVIVNNTTSLSIFAGSFIESTGQNRVAGNGTTNAPNAVYTVQ
jgi:hypothetical protein